MYLKELTEQVICRPDYPVVHTKYGKVRGIYRGGCFIFRGIEYAKAERFQMPEEPDCWEGIKNTFAYGPVPSELSTMLPRDAFTVPHFWYPQSEFCQNLNVWTPTIQEGEKKPVMVWIHGGGQEHGSAIEIMAYDGEELAQWGDVVVVSVNHRLNALGYLDLSAFGKQYRDSGYVGMQDLVMSLKWIRENISFFGGDPDNVMLFGQSGGGFKIIELMQMPDADGLYNKVSIQSGTGHDTLLYPDMSAQIGKDVADYFGLTQANIGELAKMPYYRLAAGVNHAYKLFQKRTGGRLQWTPPVDKQKYFGNPQMEGIIFRKEADKIPMLIGSVLGEFDSSSMSEKEYGDINTWGQDTVQKLLLEKYGCFKNEIVTEFKKSYPDKRERDALYVDTFMRKPHMDLVNMRVERGCAPVYNWMLTMNMPCYGKTAPWHNSDEAFVFHHAEYVESQYVPGLTEHVQDAMAGAWVSFARNGNPNHEGLRRWKPAEKGKLYTMLFQEECSLVVNHDRKLIELLEKSKAFGIGGNGPKRSYGGAPRAHV